MDNLKHQPSTKKEEQKQKTKAKSKKPTQDSTRHKAKQQSNKSISCILYNIILFFIFIRSTMVVFVASWLVVDVDFKLLPLSCSFPFFLSRESSEDTQKSHAQPQDVTDQDDDDDGR
jgi:uncharacterized membrane protein